MIPPRTAASNVRPKLLVIPVALFILSGCNADDSRRMTALENRVDSLAVTLTAVTNQLNRNGGTPEAGRRDTVTVGLAGVASEGRDDAPVTIVEFTDYQCPFCARHARTTLLELRRKYIATGKVRYVIRDLPLDIHPFAKPSARAARCVAAQASEAFWAFHDSLFARQSTLSASTPREIARHAGLDLERFDACVASGRFDDRIAADEREAGRLGLMGTPTFVIGRTGTTSTLTGEVVRGAFPITAFDEVLGRALSGPKPTN